MNDMNSKTNKGLGGGRVGSVKRGALGKGLGALIPGKVDSRRDYFECPISRIKPAPDQPRRTFDERSISELAESISRTGIIQPLVVRQDGGDYRLIAGERRYRASTKLGLSVVPVVIKDVSPDVAFELALVENIQREDLNPVEEAEAYQRLMNLREYTQEALAESLGKSRSTVANTLRLLKLVPEVQDRVVRGELSSGAARAILAVPEEAQASVAEAAVEHAMNVRQLEAVARRVKGGAGPAEALEAELSPAAEGRAPAPSPRQRQKHKAPRKIKETPLEDRAALADELMEIFATQVDFYEEEGNPEAGSIEIIFEDSKELGRIVALLRQLDRG
jgi:ParB family chromosome partitioning protein